MTQKISTHVLDNGLTVNLKEIHTAPIVSSWIWYRVGSLDETKGCTGASHWVEHMQFKGTEKFPAGFLDREITRMGGVWNALTSMDWTTYYETVPAHQFEICLALEADRMVNSSYTDETVALERHVIISEREGHENQPQFLLAEAIQMAAFKSHPYQHEVIGFKEDLKTMTRDDLFHHYKHFYRPNNAILAIAGDFETSTMLEKVNQHFGDLPGGDALQRQFPQESFAQGEILTSISGPGQTSFVKVSYHAPAANHPDFFALTVLDSLLTGPSSLNMFGSGGTSNKTSRLYRALVEEEIAVSCYGSLQATFDPFLYQIHLTVHPEQSPEAVLAAVDQEINRIMTTKITQSEIQRAIKQARALFAFSSENITNQAFWMGYPEMFASYDWFENYVHHLAQITPEDVLQTAKTYLVPENRVVGFYIPEESSA
jgi:zinc protease